MLGRGKWRNMVVSFIYCYFVLVVSNCFFKIPVASNGDKWVSCGAGAASSKLKCDMIISGQVLSTMNAIFQTVTFLGTAGAGAAVTSTTPDLDAMQESLLYFDELQDIKKKMDALTEFLYDLKTFSNKVKMSTAAQRAMQFKDSCIKFFDGIGITKDRFKFSMKIKKLTSGGYKLGSGENALSSELLEEEPNPALTATLIIKITSAIADLVIASIWLATKIFKDAAYNVDPSKLLLFFRSFILNDIVV